MLSTSFCTNIAIAFTASPSSAYSMARCLALLCLLLLILEASAQTREPQPPEPDWSFPEWQRPARQPVPGDWRLRLSGAS